jgi:hypothetical protein
MPQACIHQHLRNQLSHGQVTAKRAWHKKHTATPRRTTTQRHRPRQHHTLPSWVASALRPSSGPLRSSSSGTIPSSPSTSRSTRSCAMRSPSLPASGCGTRYVWLAHGIEGRGQADHDEQQIAGYTTHLYFYLPADRPESKSSQV